MDTQPFARCAAALLLLAGCATTPTPPAPPADPAALSRALDRVSWGVNLSTYQQAEKIGYNAWLEQQLHPKPSVLPAAAQAQIDALTISQKPALQLVQELEAQRRDYDKAMVDDDAKKAAQRAYQQELNRLAKEAATRSLLRNLYSPNQLQEQMTWFWMNHFNVHQGKSNLRVLVGDYEEQAIRPHALGKFRDLLAATLRHPAMIRYLDNEQNTTN